jgi:hypothetical protein
MTPPIQLLPGGHAHARTVAGLQPAVLLHEEQCRRGKRPTVRLPFACRPCRDSRITRPGLFLGTREYATRRAAAYCTRASFPKDRGTFCAGVPCIGPPRDSCLRVHRLTVLGLCIDSAGGSTRSTCNSNTYSSYHSVTCSFF